MRSSPDHDPTAAPLSKTRRKKQMLALQSLGERLVGLPQAQLDALPLPEPLGDAVAEARRIRSHEGRRRQLQYIGRLMRETDATAIEAALAVDDQRHRRSVQAMHAAERWRDGLLDGSLSLTDFVAQYPVAAGAGLTDALARARREQSAERPPRAQRLLYQQLHRLIAETAAEELAADDDAIDAIDHHGA
ncbi:MAG: ribosome biogenesis factor YjgA [Lautropia sp.]